MEHIPSSLVIPQKNGFLYFLKVFTHSHSNFKTRYMVLLYVTKQGTEPFMDTVGLVGLLLLKRACDLV